MTQDPPVDAPRYALIFRTHFWDGFAQRQLDRVRTRARGADIFVLVDETRGKVAGIGSDRIVGLTDDDIVAAGFPRTNEGSIQWYSGDVPLYLFHLRYPDYDYYLQMEYDVSLNVDLDRLVERLRADRVDMLGFTNPEPVEQWHWRETCLEVYRPEEIRLQLICFSAFSSKAVSVLYESRLQQAALYKIGDLTRWPYCEGYVASEAVKQGLNVAELSRYGDVEAYDWWPPYVESDLRRLRRKAFVHPVLDRRRYVPSLFKRAEGLRWLLYPTSPLHRKLRRLGPLGYLRALLGKDFLAELRIAVARRARGGRAVT